MKLGAQFYSIRTECQTHEDLYNSMNKIKNIGYEIIQISGVCDIEAEKQALWDSVNAEVDAQLDAIIN